jgi:uncharacterized cupredoxin-like copper-binding protein
VAEAEGARVKLRRSRIVPLVVFLAAATCASASATIPLGVKTIELTIRHSRFSATELHFERGQQVRFVVRNTDPIDHELIVGPMPVQLRHESGREAHHPPVPGEVSVPLLETASTTYAFERSGTVWFGCHLPGHWAYGMQGRVEVG